MGWTSHHRIPRLACSFNWNPWLHLDCRTFLSRVFWKQCPMYFFLGWGHSCQIALFSFFRVLMWLFYLKSPLSHMLWTVTLMQPILGKIAFHSLQMSSAPLTWACGVWVLLSKWHCADGVSPNTKEGAFWSKNSASISSGTSVVSHANKNSPSNHAKLQSLPFFPASAGQSQVSADP